MCVLTYLHGWNKIHFDGHTYLFHATSKEEEMIGSHAAWTEALHQSVTTHDTLKSHKTVPPDHLRSGALYLGIDSAIVPNPSRMSHVVISKLQSERNAALRCVQTISYYRDYEIPTCKKAFTSSLNNLYHMTTSDSLGAIGIVPKFRVQGCEQFQVKSHKLSSWNYSNYDMAWIQH